MPIQMLQSHHFLFWYDRIMSILNCIDAHWTSWSRHYLNELLEIICRVFVCTVFALNALKLKHDLHKNIRQHVPVASAKKVRDDSVLLRCCFHVWKDLHFIERLVYFSNYTRIDPKQLRRYTFGISSMFLYFEGILLYFESVLLHFESMTVYFESITVYFENITVYFESIIVLQFESLLLVLQVCFCTSKVYFCISKVYFCTLKV